MGVGLSSSDLRPRFQITVSTARKPWLVLVVCLLGSSSNKLEKLCCLFRNFFSIKSRPESEPGSLEGTHRTGLWEW